MRFIKTTTSVLAFAVALLASTVQAGGDDDKKPPVVVPPANRCTSGVCCNLFTQTPHPATKMCRPPCGDCDKPEYCNGRDSFCPEDDVLPSTTVCRPAVGDCDVEEKCIGKKGDKNSFYCPADKLKEKTVKCRSAPTGSNCENDRFCDGDNPTCPPRDFKSPSTLCRGSVGDTCNPPEYCTGYAPFCPPDVKLDGCPCSTVTLAEDDKCAVIKCNNGVCEKVPKPAGTLCEVGDILKCTQDAYCDGQSSKCTSKRVPKDTVCRASKGFCDPAETCPESGDCPVETKTEYLCRPAAGDCDEPDYCNYDPKVKGSSPLCPTDAKKKSTAVCRPSISACDLPEKCDGKTNVCPPDAFSAAGSPCNINDPSSNQPVNTENECDAPDSCSGMSPFCVDNRYQCFEPEGNSGSGAVSYSAALLESEVVAGNSFHPIAIVARPASEQVKKHSASSVSGSNFRSVGRRD